MTPFERFQEALNKTKVVRPPKHLLATFGTTDIRYYLVSEMAGFRDRCRLRLGQVMAEKPRIITSETLEERFSGFGPEAAPFWKHLQEHFGDSLRGLAYRFRNEPENDRVEYRPAPELLERITKALEQGGQPRTTLLSGPDVAWQLSLLKFIVEICTNSFQTNIRELDEHGFFGVRSSPSASVQEARRREVEELIHKAAGDFKLLPLLAEKLKSYQLFGEFEETFFQLLKHHQKNPS